MPAITESCIEKAFLSVMSSSLTRPRPNTPTKPTNKGLSRSFSDLQSKHGKSLAKSSSLGKPKLPNLAATMPVWSINGASNVQTKQTSPKLGRIVPDGSLHTVPSPIEQKKRCGWITFQSDAAYVAYHDMEWGVPVHDDRKLFELLVLVGAQTELTWPMILGKRELFRDAFAGFDPDIVAKFGEENILSLKAKGIITQQEGKLRDIVNNANQVLEIQKEFGSFDHYLWSFVNHRPIVNKYQHPKQIPVRTPKSEFISRDLMKRGFRFVGPTAMHSFMQSVGMTNDHLVTCFRYKECSYKALELNQANKYSCLQTGADTFTKANR